MEPFDQIDVDTIWMNGDFYDWDDAQIHVLTPGLHYGFGVFEGARAYETDNGAGLFRWDAHLDRFYHSLATYHLDIEYTRTDLTQATNELITTQNLDSCYIRPITFVDYHNLGLHISDSPLCTAIAVWPLDAYLGEDGLTQGVDVGLSSWRKIASSQLPTNAKATGQYLNSILATQEAARNGYDEGILLNKDGHVAEGPGENLFLVRDQTIYTPGLSQSILDGITRRSIVQVARDQGYEVHDDAIIDRGELYTADELFFTGTAAEVTPIRSVDGISIGDGDCGPITESIQDAFFDIVHGNQEAYEGWITHVNA